MGSAPVPAHDAVLAIRDAGVPVLLLREAGDPAADGGPRATPGTLQVLVPTASRPVVEGVLEPLSWRYSWVRDGLSRLVPMVSWWWDGGSELEVYWACPAAPLPSRVLSRLTGILWSGAVTGPDGLGRPEPAARTVHLAVQASRPGPGHDDDWRELGRLAPAADRDRVLALAREAGVSRGVRRALDAVHRGDPRPRRGGLFDGPTDIAWRLALAVQARVGPRLRRLLAGTPALGDATLRARVGGVEVLAGPGVFVPTPDADLFVELGAEGLDGAGRPVVVEVGTGCGAIALAIAGAHPHAEVHATEVQGSALRWARHNAARLGMGRRVRFHHGSLLDPLPAQLRGRVDLVAANLPFYPADGYAPIGSLPRGTIEGSGGNGLDLVGRLARDARAWLRPGGRILLQMFAWQWEAFGEELARLGYRPGAARISGPFAIGAAELRAPDAAQP